MKTPKKTPSVSSALRKDTLKVPDVIRDASGIRIYGRRLKSFLFSTDVATICYSNADAILAVYPQTPHPSIVSAISTVSTAPVFAGVGGGLTSGKRSADIALFAEAEGVMGVVVNAPMPVETIEMIERTIDSPIIATIVSAYNDIDARLKAGVDILNVASGKDTPNLVAWIRERYPDVPIIATGGRTDDSIREVIAAGPNAISWTPPTTGELFKKKMDVYRKERREEFIESHDGMTLNEYEQHLEDQD